jgi:DNA segregation ATPase FtsK/SpoIIIE, S-DNA-T family
MVRSQSPPQPRSTSDSLVEDLLNMLLSALGHAAVIAGRLLWWALCLPLISVPALASGYVAWTVSWLAGAFTIAAFGLIFIGWRLADSVSFHQMVSGPVWGRWRRWWVYRKPWPEVCAMHGLSGNLNGEVVIPVLRRVTVGYVRDHLTVRMLCGQTPGDWANQSEALAHAFGAQTCRIRQDKPGWVRIEVLHTDPLATPFVAPAPAESTPLDRVPVGVAESGEAWTLRLLGRHILIAGATGAGKGSVVWSTLWALGPQLRSGLVQAWVIDPKGGMELAPGAALFDRFAYESPQAMRDLLAEAVDVMRARAFRLRGHSRLHQPSVAEPLIVVVVDEIAALTAYVTDRKLRTEIEGLLSVLLSQGRAVGVSVIAAVQDPSKDTLSMRQLFPTRIALRLTEPSQAGMVLGDSARHRGALADQIPDTQPGVGYVAEDGTADIVRVRAFHVTDNDIAWLINSHTPLHRPGVAPDDAG